MTKHGASQEGLIIGEKPRRGNDGIKQRGQSMSWKGGKEARCIKFNEAGHFKQNYLFQKKYKEEKEGTNLMSFATNLERENTLLVVLGELGRIRKIKTVSVGKWKRYVVQQGCVGQLTLISNFLFIGAPRGVKFLVKNHLEVPPHVEEGLKQVQC